ncbi:hypothetical protein DFH08DRAFT_815891 [Mycena albidolilacea]|uniref:Uncharacterized protein n=1 Tax=Mycena albidolilacea TaxID=1033008 RepID=A0AAD6ZLG7_9AGAR|nr:hypothetical protein DFH08DRAFT_815891 [Mycena albidolilacea]
MSRKGLRLYNGYLTGCPMDIRDSISLEDCRKLFSDDLYPDLLLTSNQNGGVGETIMHRKLDINKKNHATVHVPPLSILNIWPGRGEVSASVKSLIVVAKGKSRVDGLCNSGLFKLRKARLTEEWLESIGDGGTVIMNTPSSVWVGELGTSTEPRGPAAGLWGERRPLVRGSGRGSLGVHNTAGQDSNTAFGKRQTEVNQNLNGTHSLARSQPHICSTLWSSVAWRMIGGGLSLDVAFYNFKCHDSKELKQTPPWSLLQWTSYEVLSKFGTRDTVTFTEMPKKI